MSLSVIIPVYNEKENLRATLLTTLEYLHSHVDQFELICVDDGSTDGSLDILAEFAKSDPKFQLVRHTNNSGKGEAIRTGIAKAVYLQCLFLDADFSTHIKEWDKFAPAFEAGHKVVTASRHLKDSKITVPQSFIRRTLGSGYRILSRILFGLKISDFNCGFKAYRTDLAKKVYSQTRMDDWTFDVEVFCILKSMGYSVHEIPVTWEHKDKHSNIKPISTAFKTLKSLFTLKRRFAK
ncbi:MAG: dolichyl-phosphate beta-glucosyltransferase [Candidatus Omnitrophota bacterium]|jgi:dolichyl-phosphate beta-glucosyltransferase